MIQIIGNRLSQWDVGRLVEVTGEASHVHFANQGDSKAVIIDVEEGKAKIPDYLLQTGKTLLAYAVLNGVTLESYTFAVRKRERPENYVYEEDQRNFIYVLIQDAENAIARAIQTADEADRAAYEADLAAHNARGASVEANAAANNATVAADSANKAATKAAHTAKSLMVVGEAKGVVIALDDAIDQFLVGCRIFGKTTQDGTPTPDAPVDLVSVGDVGSVTVTVAGKNLISNNWLQGMLKTEDGTTIVRNDYWVTNADYIAVDSSKDYVFSADTPNSACVYWYDEDKNFISFEQPLRNLTSQNNQASKVLKLPDYAKYVRFAYNYSGSTEAITPAMMGVNHYIQLEIGFTPTAYEPYICQNMAIAAPNGLPGIPVTTGGNYTDANGQQWICDEIYFARGVYVQRIGKVVLNSQNSYVHVSTHGDAVRFDVRNIKAYPSSDMAFCTHLPVGVIGTNNAEVCSIHGVSGYPIIQILSSRLESVDASGLVKYLEVNPMTFYYVLATPTETPMPEEELIAYAALHTYKDHTTVSNDAGAWMDLEYVMDAKKYIDYLVAAPIPRLATITLSSASWTGADSLYSQVVSISGITPYSKVDLLPSVEQLAIFHNKDVAFVTENENGVVTVYAIGDKPLLDYTMQAQITEVEV